MVALVEYEGGHEERILGGDARILRANRSACPVCGDPNGDCTGESDPPRRVFGTDLFPSLGHEETYVVPEDVWKEVQISQFTTTRVLVAAKGTAMLVSKAKELGLL
jgi:hypothetical protein